MNPIQQNKQIRRFAKLMLKDAGGSIVKLNGLLEAMDNFEIVAEEVDDPSFKSPQIVFRLERIK